MSLWGKCWRSTVGRFGAIALGMAVGATVASPLVAQVVRGRVTERTTNTPLDGVLLAILNARDSIVVQALSNDDGTYEIRLPGPGSYAMDAKRIGVKRIRIAPFTVAAGEARRVDITLDPLPAVLSSVNIRGRTSCVRNPQSNARTAALWEDARAALTASVISRDLAAGTGADSVMRFERKLDVQTWRVLYETRRKVSTSMDHPFRSLPAEVLSVGGYVTVNQDGSTDYYAPDAEVLLSDTFLADHCFKTTRGGMYNPGMIGLAFQPVPEHKKPDIKGTLWMDAKTGELRTVDFTYTWLPNDVRTADYGGTVSFFRLPGGRWIVRSWRIRMPEFGYQRFNPNNVGRTPVIVRISEEGGAVPLMTLLNQGGLVAGRVVIDTVNNRPIPGITVALEGTGDSTRTAMDGTFQLPFVAPGSYTVVLRHPALDSLGIHHLARTIDVDAGQSTYLTLAFPSNEELASRMCQAPVDVSRNSIIRFLIVDRTSGSPLANTPVVFSRYPVDDAGKPVADSAAWFEVKLDDRGGFLVCGLRNDEVVRIEAGPEDPTPWAETLRPRRGAIGWHVIRVPRKR